MVFPLFASPAFFAWKSQLHILGRTPLRKRGPAFEAFKDVGTPWSHTVDLLWDFSTKYDLKNVAPTNIRCSLLQIAFPDLLHLLNHAGDQFPEATEGLSNDEEIPL